MAEYPLPKFHFSVEWGDVRFAFSKISGMDVETELIEYRDGNSPEYSKIKMPGMQKNGNITMKRGTFKGQDAFYKWYDSITLNKVDRRTVTINLLNEEHQPVVVWTAKNAWPLKVQATDLKADGNEVAIETMEVVHEGLTVQYQ